MKKIRQLRAKKGFTLIECLVAIAIFSMMSLIVAQILAISIKSYARNDRVDKDLDVQLENLVKSNNTVKRDTFDLTLEFLKSDDSSAGSMSVAGINVIRNNDTGSSQTDADRMELNALTYSIDANASSDSESSSDPEDDTPGEIKNYMHIYGSKGFESIYAEEVSDTDSGGIHTIKIRFKLNDPDKVLAESYINSVKVALPASATDFKVSGVTGGLKSLFLGQTVRMYLPTDPSGNTIGQASYDFEIEFRLSDSAYSEYGTFAKFFIDINDAGTEKSATFVENMNHLGIYNVKQGTIQAEE